MIVYFLIRLAAIRSPNTPDRATIAVSGETGAYVVFAASGVVAGGPRSVVGRVVIVEGGGDGVALVVGVMALLTVVTGVPVILVT